MKFFSLIAVFVFFISSLSYSQIVDTAKVLDSIKINIEKKEYNNALSFLDLLIKENPKNEDYLIYKGRIHSWNKDYPKAIEILKPLTRKETLNTEALEALINTYFWASMYHECINEADRYLLTKPSSGTILIKKAICLEKLSQDKEAIKILNTLAARDTTKTVEALQTSIYRKNKNLISLSYLNTSFYNPNQSPWHVSYIEYARKFDASSVIARIINGNVFNHTERKYEIDFYQKFSNKSYLYINGGISDGSNVFSKYNTAIEYYFTPINKINYSFGLRYLDFRSVQVTLLTGQVEYQLKNNYSIKYRPYLDINNMFLSHVLSLRKTNEVKERFVQLDFQYGSVPYLYIYNNATVPLNAYRFGIQYQVRVNKNYFVKPVLLYEYEEFLPDTYRNKLNCQLILSKRF